MCLTTGTHHAISERLYATQCVTGEHDVVSNDLFNTFSMSPRHNKTKSENTINTHITNVEKIIIVSLRVCTSV